MNPLEWFQTAWDFVLNPPAHVVSVNTELIQDLTVCSVSALIKYGNAMLDIIVGMV